MKVEFKNVKVIDALSEETICFTGKMYIDGKYAADVSNRGCGGQNDIDWVDQSYRQPFEDYCNSLPALEEYEMTLPMNEDLFISIEIGKIDEEKQKQSALKKLKKNILKGLCFGKNELEYSMLSWKGQTIESMLNIPAGKIMLIREIDKIKSEGYTILNDNLGELL